MKMTVEKVVGTLEQFDYEGMDYLCINISLPHCKTGTGAEYVVPVSGEWRVRSVGYNYSKKSFS